MRNRRSLVVNNLTVCMHECSLDGKVCASCSKGSCCSTKNWQMAASEYSTPTTSCPSSYNLDAFQCECVSLQLQQLCWTHARVDEQWWTNDKQIIAKWWANHFRSTDLPHRGNRIFTLSWPSNRSPMFFFSELKTNITWRMAVEWKKHDRTSK